MAMDPRVEAICVGPSTFVRIVEEFQGPEVRIHPGVFEWLHIFGKRTVLVVGIPDGEIIPSSYPPTPFTGLRSILSSAKEK